MSNYIRWETYANYKSGNYGAHALVFSTPRGDVYFSYKTPVAFRTPETGLVIRKNDWGPTTGKHLNAIDPDHKKRIDGVMFEAQLKAVFGE